jgi:hypothetical protein
MLAQMSEISKRQQKTRPWLALLLASVAFFFLSTLSLYCYTYEIFIQVQYDMLSSDFDFNNRLFGSLDKFQHVVFVDLFAGSMIVSIC